MGCVLLYQRRENTLFHLPNPKGRRTNLLDGDFNRARFVSETILLAGQPFLPQSENLPPGEADAHPDGNVDKGDDQPKFPPGFLVHIPSIKVDGGRPSSIVGDASAQGGEKTEDQGRNTCCSK